MEGKGDKQRPSLSYSRDCFELDKYSSSHLTDRHENCSLWWYWKHPHQETYPFHWNCSSMVIHQQMVTKFYKGKNHACICRLCAPRFTTTPGKYSNICWTDALPLLFEAIKAWGGGRLFVISAKLSLSWLTDIQSIQICQDSIELKIPTQPTIL